MSTFPTLRPIADTGILVEFGDRIADDIHTQVLALDQAVRHARPLGVTETVPAFASVMICYDPLLTDYNTLAKTLEGLMVEHAVPQASQNWRIPVCYDAQFAPDMDAVCDQLGYSVDHVITVHSSASYKVYMYGFAPGYAYLGGVPDALQLPRKTAPVKDVLPRSVMITGPQALITTVTMPSGWWVIGRSGVNPLNGASDQPFLFGVGDTVTFEPISAKDFAKYGGV